MTLLAKCFGLIAMGITAGFQIIAYKYHIPYSITVNVLISQVLLCVMAVVLYPKVKQDQTYHNFADKRNLCCVPNTMDVVSNIPFLLFGIYGLWVINYWVFYFKAVDRVTWIVFFIGCFLTGIGSAYYHWKPTSNRLVWDRLPMTICFTSIFSALVKERIVMDDSLWSLLSAILFFSGIFSVWYWHFTDDLRPYIFIQFFPLLCIPTLMTIQSPLSAYYIYLGLGAYVLAKILEIKDREIFRINGYISGHTLKHLTASLTMLSCVFLVLEREEYFKRL